MLTAQHKTWRIHCEFMAKSCEILANLFYRFQLPLFPFSEEAEAESGKILKEAEAF